MIDTIKERHFMENLKWYSGGSDRKKKAMATITDLLNDLKMDLGNESLQNVLENYLEELEQANAAVPIILGRMNIDISTAIRKDGVTLSEIQSKKLKELISISYIKYGY